MQINWLGVVLAVLAGRIVAGIWYGKLFLATWWKLTGITPEQSKAASNRNVINMTLANATTALGLAAAIAVTSSATDIEAVWLALVVGFAAWLGFSATTLLVHNTFELKPSKLTAINSGYQLALFLAMSLTIGLL